MKDRKKSRLIGAGVAVLAMVLLGLFGSATGASASAQSCNVACIDVQGTSTWVDTVQPGMTIGARQRYTGHTETWGSGFHYNTADQLFDNFASSYGWRSYSGPRYSMYRTFPNNSQICSRVWRKDGGSYYNMGTACITVHN
jgi:hypothetical protein